MSRRSGRLERRRQLSGEDELKVVPTDMVPKRRKKEEAVYLPTMDEEDRLEELNIVEPKDKELLEWLNEEDPIDLPDEPADYDEVKDAIDNDDGFLDDNFLDTLLVGPPLETSGWFFGGSSLPKNVKTPRDAKKGMEILLNNLLIEMEEYITLYDSKNVGEFESSSSKFNSVEGAENVKRIRATIEELKQYLEFLRRTRNNSLKEHNKRIKKYKKELEQKRKNITKVDVEGIELKTLANVDEDEHENLVHKVSKHDKLIKDLVSRVQKLEIKLRNQ